MVVLGNRFEFIKFIEWFLIIDKWKPKNLGPSRVGLKVSSDRKAWLGLEARKYVIGSNFLAVFSLSNDSEFLFGFLSKLFGVLAPTSSFSVELDFKIFNGRKPYLCVIIFKRVFNL